MVHLVRWHVWRRDRPSPAGPVQESDGLNSAGSFVHGVRRDFATTRLEFYTQRLAVESRSYFMPAGPEESCYAHLAALLTDLSPSWILDCYTDRLGELAGAKAKD